MKIFVSGGCKNGKSHFAQRLAKSQQTASLYYIATMKSVDGEDDHRIAKHRADREGWGFSTVEQSADIEKILQKCDWNGSFLLDSLTALLANEMFLADGSVNENAAEKITGGLAQLFEAIGRIVIVSDYIYSDAAIYDELTEKYRKSLAQIDWMAAKNCDIVLEAAYTNVIIHKGSKIW
ncbi:MAG: bifunctional adenosylcobinamide kinase/adenosylcobinamide-phosphate guanylyltransferase [Oscillospiraceae bacterium]|nr:bifunctional adenosylcobinamide kinase/adenosylcobinamide-phosphate guanylyltransferase [Oscillospiraceae bacterium]